MIEDDLEAGRIAPKGVKQGSDADREKEPELAGKEASAGDPVPEEEEGKS